MTIRWWRVGVLFERDGSLWTETFHVRAFTREAACRMVAERLDDRPHEVYACQASDPLLRVVQREEIVAAFGPYRRDPRDPTLAARRGSDILGEHERPERQGIQTGGE